MHLTPKIFFSLQKSSCFGEYFSEKNVGFGQILNFLCPVWTLIAVKRYRMERYSILQASDVTTTSNNKSVRHIWDQYRSNLPNITSEWCEIARNTDCWVLEVTSQQSPDPSSLKRGREPKWRRFSLLQRGRKVQRFDQIQKLFRLNTHQSMKIFLAKKIRGLLYFKYEEHRIL